MKLTPGASEMANAELPAQKPPVPGSGDTTLRGPALPTQADAVRSGSKRGRAHCAALPSFGIRDPGSGERDAAAEFVLSLPKGSDGRGDILSTRSCT